MRDTSSTAVVCRLAFVMIIASLVGCHAADQTKDLLGSRPNILFAIADDISYPHMGAYGCEWVQTPAFDLVASQGVRFDNCYTPNAKCAPSRAVLLTGRYSWQLEEAANHIGFWPEDKYPTFCEVLGQAGYAVGFTGKGWAPGNPGTRDGKPRQLTGAPFQRHKLIPPTAKISANDYAANFEEFLDGVAGETPWVFWYGGHEPHRDYEYGSGAALGGMQPQDIDRVPDFWPDSDTVRNDMLDYAYEINHFDSHLMKMIRKLEAAGQLDNTIIIVTADNGMPFPRAKGMQYEYSNHLPLAVMWKKGIKRPGRHEEALVSFVDIAPTLLELAGVHPDEIDQLTMSGTALLDVLANNRQHERDFILLGQERHDYGRPQNQGYPIRSIIRDGYLYIHNFKPDLWPAGNPETGYLNTDGSPTKSQILSMRRNGADERFWNLNFGKHPQEELYQLTTDRECLHNLAAEASLQSLKEEMKKTLFEQLRKQGDPRVLGNGDIFDQYPFAQQSSFFFYERYKEGEIKTYQTDWVNPSDYEKEVID